MSIFNSVEKRLAYNYDEDKKALQQQAIEEMESLINLAKQKLPMFKNISYVKYIEETTPYMFFKAILLCKQPISLNGNTGIADRKNQNILDQIMNFFKKEFKVIGYSTWETKSDKTSWSRFYFIFPYTDIEGDKRYAELSCEIFIIKGGEIIELLF